MLQKKLAGICVVRNARDLIGLACAHYLRIGFGHIRIIDDGSTDGTYDLLCRLARKEKRVSVSQVSNTEFHQAELMSEMANDLIRDGYSMILPFDADEFWNVSGPALEARYARHSEITFLGNWVNFVNNEQAMNPRPFYLLGIKYRAPVLDDADETTITQFKRPWVCSTLPKIGFKTTRPVELRKGQHALTVGPSERDSNLYEVFHVPLRSRSELFKRALDREPRVAPLREHPSTGFQSSFHRRAFLDGRVDDVWRANSADWNGFLDCYGRPVALEHDNRLRTLILKSYAYVALRYRMLLP